MLTLCFHLVDWKFMLMGSGEQSVMTFLIRSMRTLLASNWVLSGQPATSEAPVQG